MVEGGGTEAAAKEYFQGTVLETTRHFGNGARLAVLFDDNTAG